MLHLPGHSPGSIALYEHATATLFAGDVVYADGDELLDDIHGSNRADYLDTIRRLRGLAVATVYPGHGPSFDGARLRQICDHYITTRSGHG